MEDPKIVVERVLANVERVIIGKTSEVRLALICFMCQGHLLIEDVPGVGKTMLARSLALSAGCSFNRHGGAKCYQTVTATNCICDQMQGQELAGLAVCLFKAQGVNGCQSCARGSG